MKLALITLLISLVLLTACDVNRVQVKLTDFQYEGTENGFKVSSDNYTDIIINQDSNTARLGEVVAPSTPPLPPGTTEDEDIKENLSLQAEVENNTIKISVK